MPQPLTVIKAESESELYADNLVPIYEEYAKRNSPDKEKAFRIVPRKFATKLLRFEPNSLISEDELNEDEKKTLTAFAKKKYFKSAKVAGKTFYFDLNIDIRKYLGTVIGR